MLMLFSFVFYSYRVIVVVRRIFSTWAVIVFLLVLALFSSDVFVGGGIEAMVFEKGS